MNISVPKLNDELNKINKLLEEYEINYLNLYNEISNSSFFWNDSNSIKFYENKKIEKQKVFKSITEFQSLKEVYEYISHSYQNLGNKITCDMKYKNDIINHINEMYNYIDDIQNDYENLDLTFCELEKNIIMEQRKKIDKNKQEILKLKNRYIEIFNDINNIENQVKLKLDKINIENYKEN